MQHHRRLVVVHVDIAVHQNVCIRVTFDALNEDDRADVRWRCDVCEVGEVEVEVRGREKFEVGRTC